MTTSGSTDFELDVADIIEEAYERCGLEVRTGYDARTARRSLNIMFADWANRGLNLWTVEFAAQTVASGVVEYPLAPITMTVSSSSSFSVGETITGGTSSATASILTLPTSTTMTLNVPSGTFAASETITGGTSSASTTVSAVLSFEDSRAVGDLLDIVIRRSGTDLSMTTLARGDYLAIPNKATTGRPTQYYFDRQISPVLNVWPTPENSTDELRYYYVKRIQDADALVNTTDVPFRFFPCMIAGLAYYIALKKAPQRVQMLKVVYEEEFQRAADEDEDRVSLKLQPDIQYLRV
tara:strand:+ start:1493 stop:2377 length:885 start_codon:yes stop_codon:yes gene_type:complete